MTRSHKIKVISLFALSAMLIFYVRTVPQISLNERALVVGMAVDYDEEQGFSISVQMISSVSSGQASSSDDSYAISTGTAKTMAGAISKIAQKTGLIVSLSQCDIIILGEGVLKASVFPALNYLVQSYQIPEQAVVAATTKEGVELLRVMPLTTNISAFQLQQSLIAMRENDLVIGTDIKDFMTEFLSKSGVSAVDFVTFKEVPAENSGAPGQGSADKKYYEYVYGNSILFKSGGSSDILTNDDTFSINMVLEKVKTGGLIVNIDETNFSLNLSKKQYKQKSKFVDGRIRYSGQLKVDYILEEVDDMNKYFSIDQIDGEMLNKIAEKAQSMIKGKIIDTFLKCAEMGYDVFNIYNKTYKSEGVKLTLPSDGDYLSLTDFAISVNVKISRK